MNKNQCKAERRPVGYRYWKRTKTKDAPPNSDHHDQVMASRWVEVWLMNWTMFQSRQSSNMHLWSNPGWWRCSWKRCQWLCSFIQRQEAMTANDRYLSHAW